MFANYLIGLREGLEASLIVGILVAYVVKAGKSERLGMIWAGTGIAVALSLGFAGVLTLTSHSLSDTAEATFAGTMSTQDALQKMQDTLNQLPADRRSASSYK